MQVTECLHLQCSFIERLKDYRKNDLMMDGLILNKKVTLILNALPSDPWSVSLTNPGNRVFENMVGK